jgi:ABC-type lipoprotein export system ATPase subunit
MSFFTTLAMPQPGISNAEVAVATPEGSVVIIGANGSGKTRLGAWLEFTSSQKSAVRRIGAQKSLGFPENVSPIALQDAISSLDIGIDAQQYIASRDIYSQNPSAHRVGNKWSRHPETALVNDYDKLLTLLVSEQYEVSLGYTLQAKKQSIYSAPPETKLDQVKRIWEQVLPHRELVLKASTVAVKPIAATATAYKASAMSDGERVAFYLIGQCLAAPINSIIVVDEPEIHLHRVIQSRLWDAIERERPDCLLVYLTHDLDFAASRTGATKLWIKGFDGNAWDWQLVPPEQEGLPEEVLLAVLGSRKPILFVEGQRGSLDRVFFSRIYPDWTIMPREGCDQVIEATRAFRGLKHLHGLECYGIVDRDYRSPQQAAELLVKGVHVLDLQEMENLLLIEPVLQQVADLAHTQSMTADTPAEIIRKAKARIFSILSQNIDVLASHKTAWEMETKLHKINRKVTGVAKLEQVRNEAAQFDVAGTYAAFEQQLTQILTNENYAALLRIYNNKGLGEQISLYFGTDSYPGFVKRLISNGKGEAIIAALRAAAPQLPVVATGAPTTVAAATPMPVAS